MSKKTIRLNALEGKGSNWLEFEILENGDFYVALRGQDTCGNFNTTRGKIPNPNNGEGDPRDYETLMKIYKLLESQ